MSPGADQPGHTSCGHWGGGGDRDMNGLVSEHIRVELVHVRVGNLVVGQQSSLSNQRVLI